MARPGAGGGAARSSSWMWEDLRKEARKLEGEIDVKLAGYSKLGSSLSLQSLVASASDTEARAGEIEGLLQRLDEVNAAMAQSIAGGVSDVLTHTLERHRDILQEYSQEFRRTRATLTANLQHAQLLGSFSKKDEEMGASLGPGSSSNLTGQQALLRERGQIHSASNQLDETLGQAQATMASLQQQRSVFGDVTGKMNSLGAAFPIVNQLLTSIRRKKSKDTIILTAVVVICTLFLVIYWLNK